MSKTDDAANAAGQAAYDRAEQSHWPPTRTDTEAIGTAAGAAAGAIIGGPIGASLGGIIGTAVGSAVYSLGEAIANGLDPRGPTDEGRYVGQASQTADNVLAVVKKLAKECDTNAERELQELINWGLPWDNAQWRHRTLVREVGVQRAFLILQDAQKKFFAATAARTAQCETYKKSSGSSGTKALLIVGGIGGLLWALTRAL